MNDLRRLAVLLMACAAILSGGAQAADDSVMALWPNGAPGAKGDQPADRPTLALYRPREARRNGSAVVVCPGGGYQHLALDHEGKQIAQWLTDRGITAYVLSYRLAPRYHHPAMLEDAQRALRLARSRSSEDQTRKDRLAIWGFSAGGHLAATAATHIDEGKKNGLDPVERESCRPDLAILCYPVISMREAYAHGGSRQNLLGPSPTPELANSLSNETQVTRQTPPTFLFHTSEDKPVPPENSVAFYLALRRAGVPAELHIYESGPHGVGLASKDSILSSWPARLEDWLRRHEFLPGRP